MPKPQSPPRDTVQSLCDENGMDSNGLPYNDELWIKYGTGVTMDEAAMQRYVHQHANPQIVHIPEVYDSWKIERPGMAAITYIVMENIKNDDFTAYRKQKPEADEMEQMLEEIAIAVRHIWKIPLPPSNGIGPLEEEKPRDRFFGEMGSDRIFKDAAEFEGCINSVLEEAERKERADFKGKDLHICHCDIAPHNIKVKIGEPVTIIDWGFSGIYPLDFEEYAIFHQFNREGAKFAKAIHKKLFGAKVSPSLRPVCLAANIIQFGC